MLSHLQTQGLTLAEAVVHIDERLDEDLRKWFQQKWVRFGPDGKIRGACARGSEGEGKPKCLPQKYILQTQKLTQTIKSGISG